MKLTIPLVCALVSVCLCGGSVGAEPAAKPSAGKAAQTPAAGEKESSLAGVANIPDTVAVVEGAEIKKADVEEALRLVLQQTGRSPSDIPDEQKAGAYRMVLDEMVTEKLINHRAADVKISDEEVEAAFKKVTEKVGSDEEVKKQIAQSGQTVEKVKENIRASLRQQRWIESQIKGASEVTDAELEDFYKQNPEQFKMPERIRASHILLSLKQDAAPEVVKAKQKEAEAIVARAKKGEDFAKLAKELSEDPSAKQNAGDLDFFAREQMVPEFSEVAFKLKKDEVSGPVRSEFGYHVIKLTDRKEPQTMSLEQAKPRLLAFLKQQKTQTEVEKIVRDIREKADVKINLPDVPDVAESAAAPAPVSPEPAAPVKKPSAPAPKKR